MTKAGQQRRLEQGRDVMQRIIAIWPNRRDTLVLLGDPRRASNYESGGTGISDPTPSQAFSLTSWHEHLERIDGKVGNVCRLIDDLYLDVMAVPSDVDTGRIAEQHRCNGMGQPGFDEWRWVGPGGEECWRIKDTRDGLCERCRQRRDHWRRKQEEAA